MVNIYLVGFMGAGKTSAGQQLAGKLGARFLDLDEELGDEFGCSIPEIFEQRGETVFRAAETDMLKKLCVKDGLVVATGGGAFSSPGNRKMIEDSGGISVFLDVPWTVLQQRLESDNADRPVYRNAEQALRLFEERLPAYRRAMVSITCTGDETPEQIAEAVVNAVREVPCGI